MAEKKDLVNFQLPTSRKEAESLAGKYAPGKDPFPVRVEMHVFADSVKARLRDMAVKSDDNLIEIAKQQGVTLTHKRREWKSASADRKDGDGSYNGTWNENEREGWGVYEWKDGRKYRGEWKMNKMNGIGVYTWIKSLKVARDSTPQRSAHGISNSMSSGHDFDPNTSSRYEGEWKDNCMEGWGTYRWGTDRAYEGQWKKDMMHGHGIFTWPDNSQYQGSFADDEMNGRGVKVWADGSIYGGDWKNDKRHGDGIYIWPEAKGIYQGEWFEDTAHGSGKMVWYFVESGINKEACYEGEWFKDKRHGKGVYTWPDGTKFEGEWINDEMKDGTYTYPDGLTF